MSVQKNLVENLDYDILVCINQALVSVDWVSERFYCTDCVDSISWTTYDQGPGYYLWDTGIYPIVGKWFPQWPENIYSAYAASDLRFVVQKWILHPVFQAKFFLYEATSRLTSNQEQLRKDWGKESFDQISANFYHVLDFLVDQQNILTGKEVKGIRTSPELELTQLSYKDIKEKAQSLQRVITLKLKNLIKNLENLINNGSGPRYDVSRVNHLSIPYGTPGQTTYCHQHHLVKLD